MKRSGPESTQERKSKRPRISTPESVSEINQKLPSEMFQEIISQLGFDFGSLVSFSLVSKDWQKHVLAFSRQFINQYFGYLSRSEKYESNPLWLLYAEIEFYKDTFVDLEFNLILSALRGDKTTIASVQDEKKRRQLYSIMLATGRERIDSLPLTLTESGNDEVYLDAFVLASSIGKHEVMASLLPYIHSSTVFVDALNAACTRGQLNAVRFVLTNPQTSTGLADENYASAFVSAAGEGHVEVLQYLLSRNEDAIKNDVFNRSLLKASERRKIEATKFLVTHYCFSLEDKLEAFVSACAGGDLDCVKYLDTIIFQYITDIEAALATKEIHFSDRQRMLSAATTNVKSFIAKSLLESASKGHVAVVSYLLDSKSFDRLTLKKSLKEAVIKGSIAVIKLIAEKLKEIIIIDPHWFKPLAVRGEYDKINELFNSGLIDKIPYCLLLADCRSNVEFDLAKDIIHIKLSREEKIKLLELSVEKGNIELLRILLNQMKLARSEKNKLIYMAIKAADTDCLFFLLSYLNISIANYKIQPFIGGPGITLLAYAARLFRYDDSTTLAVFNFLLEKGKWTAQSQELKDIIAERQLFHPPSDPVLVALREYIASKSTQTVVDGILYAFRTGLSTIGLGDRQQPQPTPEDAMDLDAEPSAFSRPS